MKIDHIAIYVRDLERAKSFYEKYFGAVSNAGYHNPKTGLRTYFLSFDGGACIEIMNRAEVSGDPHGAFGVGLTHIAFKVGTKERVNALAARLESDGYEIFGRPRTTGDGYYEVCARDAEGNFVEFVA